LNSAHFQQLAGRKLAYWKFEPDFLNDKLNFERSQLLADEKYLYICSLEWGISSVG
jgi:hypothetical protein